MGGSALRWIVAGLPLLLVVCGAINPCDPGINYFPTADDIGQPVNRLVHLDNGSYTTTACQGTDNCAFPDAWSGANQHNSDILAMLGTSFDVDENGVFKIAMKEYGGGKVNPVLYFTATSPLLTQNTDVAACVAAANVAASPAAAVKPLATTTYKVINPGTWQYSIKRGSDTVASDKVGNAGRLDIVGWPSTGESCALIAITVSGYSISNQPSNFPSSLSATRKVCWYRNNGQAKADISFSQCLQDDAASDDIGLHFNATISNVEPQAQNLTQNGAVVTVEGQPVLLFQPAVQVWGSYLQELSVGPTASDSLATASAARRLRQYYTSDDIYMQSDTAQEQSSYINKYYLVPASTDNQTFTIANGALQEGYYRLSAKVSVLTVLPNLVDLQGMATVNQTDVTEVAGYTEFMGWTIINGTNEATPLIGLQKASTMPALQTISGTNTSDTFTFTWRFVGVQASQVCYHDAEEILGCESPVSVKASATGNSTDVHTFRVLFTDVCGHEKNATFSYTIGSGITSMTEADSILLPGISTTTASAVKRTPSAVASLRPLGSWLILALALLGCILTATS